jgi:hypothetical protein
MREESTADTSFDSEVFKEPPSPSPAVSLWKLLVDGEKLDSELLQDCKELQLALQLRLLVRQSAFSQDES